MLARADVPLLEKAPSLPCVLITVLLEKCNPDVLGWHRWVAESRLLMHVSRQHASRVPLFVVAMLQGYCPEGGFQAAMFAPHAGLSAPTKLRVTHACLLSSSVPR